MSEIFKTILDLIDRKEMVISNHGYDEMADDLIFVRDIISGINEVIDGWGRTTLSSWHCE